MFIDVHPTLRDSSAPPCMYSACAPHSATMTRPSPRSRPVRPLVRQCRHRLERLEGLNADGEDEELARLRVPDGVAGLLTAHAADAVQLLGNGGGDGGGGGRTLLLAERGAEEGTAVDAEVRGSAPAATLHHASACYICKSPFRSLHFFYASLCPACAALNWRKREEAADLTGERTRREAFLFWGIATSVRRRTKRVGTKHAAEHGTNGAACSVALWCLWAVVLKPMFAFER